MWGCTLAMSSSLLRPTATFTRQPRRCDQHPAPLISPNSARMDSPQRVAIIGAGISGLAHADVLTRCGFSVAVFERASRIGGVWACSYPEVSLQNTWSGYHVSS